MIINKQTRKALSLGGAIVEPHDLQAILHPDVFSTVQIGEPLRFVTSSSEQDSTHLIQLSHYQAASTALSNRHITTLKPGHWWVSLQLAALVDYSPALTAEGLHPYIRWQKDGLLDSFLSLFLVANVPRDSQWSGELLLDSDLRIEYGVPATGVGETGLYSARALACRLL